MRSHSRRWAGGGGAAAGSENSITCPPRAQLLAGPPASFNNPVHAVLVTNDDTVYVADRTNNRFQVFRLDGTFIKDVFNARNTLKRYVAPHCQR